MRHSRSHYRKCVMKDDPQGCRLLAGHSVSSGATPPQSSESPWGQHVVPLSIIVLPQLEEIETPFTC